MIFYALKRLAMALLVTITVSVLAFGLLRLSGDPAIALAGEGASPQDIEFVREYYGLDRPLVVQFLDWAGKAAIGDLGWSTYMKTSVSEIISDRLPVTMTLGGCALAFALILGIPLGVTAAIRPNSMIDRLSLLIAVVGQAMPSFWFALTLIIYLGVYGGILPITGTDSWKNFVMPSVVLGYFAMPGIMRLTRAGMSQVLSSDYIRTAKAKGIRPFSVVFKHALRNAIIPVVSLAAVQFGFMLGGSIVIETIFAINGLGFLAWQSIQRSDFAMMQAIVLVLAIFYVVLTFLADMLNAYLDPRIRVS
ncbi:MAG: ABC transporter permease [Rhodospirillaceae bacterium]|nr:ABC transporter permease [Rhodospirillaceae bacterium]